MLSTRDIAKLAGVGIGTVSRYRNGFQLKQSTYEKIERAIEQLDGRLIRQLNIGVVVPVINDSFSGELLGSLEKYLSKTKHKMVVIVSTDIKADMNHILSLNLDGLIVHPPNKESVADLPPLADKLPIVLVDMMLTPAICDQILSFNIQATYNCVEYLLKLGHTKIAIATFDSFMLMGDERLHGYKRAVKDYGLGVNEDYIIDGSSDISVTKALTNLLNSKDKPTALISTNYDSTISCLRAFMSMKIEYPKDISFLGFDEIGLNKFLIKPISYVEQPIKELAKNSFEVLSKRIIGDMSGYPTTQRLLTKIIEGESICANKP